LSFGNIFPPLFSGGYAALSQPASPALGGSSNSSQTVMSSRKHRGRSYLPYTFTEQGAAMPSSLLRSARAVQVNIAIMRTFVRLHEILLSNADLARKLVEQERKYDSQFKAVLDAIRVHQSASLFPLPGRGVERSIVSE
jgi:hypothetical protein